MNPIVDTVLILLKLPVLWILYFVYSAYAFLQMFIFWATKPQQKRSSLTDEKQHDRPLPYLSSPGYGTHQFSKINGIYMHYIDAGDHSKPLMIFVHGFPEFWYSWRHQIPEFSKDYWVVAVDLRGCNLTERPDQMKNYKLNVLVEDLKALIDHFNRKKCILICHDWGAIIGWEFLTQHKNMVDRYVMMGAPSREIYGLTYKKWDQYLRSWYIIFFRIPFLPELFMSIADYAYFSAMWGHRFNQNWTQKDLDAYKHVFSRPRALSAALAYYRANYWRMTYFLDHRLWKTFDGSDGMYVLGEYDHFISRYSMELTQELYPKIRVETVAKANHFLHQDNPNGTNELIREFLGPAHKFSVENRI